MAPPTGLLTEGRFRMMSEECETEQEAAQNDAQKDTTSATDPLLRNAIDHINADTDTFNNVYSTTEQPADTNESSEYTAPDDTSNN